MLEGFFQLRREERLVEGEEECAAEGLGEYHEGHGRGCLAGWEVVLYGYDGLGVVLVGREVGKGKGGEGKGRMYHLHSEAAAKPSDDLIPDPFPGRCVSVKCRE